MLATGTGGEFGRYFQIPLVNGDVYVVNFGQDGDGGSAGVDAAL
jgi:hypothetical protein